MSPTLEPRVPNPTMTPRAAFVLFLAAAMAAALSAQAPAPVPAHPVKTDGGVLVPGLVDAHAWAAPTSELDADYFYLMGLAHGVTAYRVLNVRTTWAVSQRARAESGSTLAPRLATSGRGIDQAATPGRWLFDAPDAQAAAGEATRQAAATVEWVAGYDHLLPDAYKAIVDAVKGSSTRVSGQPGASSMSDLAAAGVATIDTLAFPVKPRSTAGADDAWLATSATELATLQTRLIRARVTLVPLLAAARARAFPDEAADDPALDFLPDERVNALMQDLGSLSDADIAKAKQAWASQAAFIRRFVRAGGKVAAGTGFEWKGYPLPGIGIHRELAALVRAGLTPADALRAATVNAAGLLGAAAGSSAGRIAPGMDANFIVVAGDPLAHIEDLERITSVIRAGEVLEVKALVTSVRRSLSGPIRK
ncbi:MAG: amidohydrolase family protein [Acidobacteria bacterium]|nr:amidohydrolase family protein [Acidobacteriota bacterium]